ncbi:DUF922 domain-containing protein [Hyunsoonleella pacifica]|nr:DUF922 domain-containing protein [Hyunsoonleella pacifica]
MKFSESIVEGYFIEKDLLKIKNTKLHKQSFTEIEWSSNRKLSWEDFRGIPDTIKFPESIAITTSSIHFKGAYPNPFKNGKLSIKAVFSMYESWVIFDDKSDALLEHEQLHFDITELYARKIRMVVKEIETSFSEEEILQTLNAVKIEYKKRQEQYDEETQHGRDKRSQKYWEELIKVELKKLEAYK